MIEVEYIFNRVNKTLSRKNQSGYSSVDDFNGDLRDSENILYEFNFKKFEESQKVSDALMPFVVEEYIPISNGMVAYPERFRHPIEMSYRYVISSPDCEEPEFGEILMDKLQTNEERDTMQSTKRKPSVERKLLYWTQLSNGIRVRPTDLTGSVIFKYFKNPVYGVYKTTIDFVRQIEVFDPVTSINLQWNEQEAVDIIDLMLVHKGLQIRDSELTQFAAQKMSLNTDR